MMRLFPLQLTDTPPESERQILRCAPPFYAQAEHENDLRQESIMTESEADYDQRMADREQDRYDMYEDGRSDGHVESYAERNT